MKSHVIDVIFTLTPEYFDSTLLTYFDFTLLTSTTMVQIKTGVLPDLQRSVDMHVWKNCVGGGQEMTTG